MTQLGVFGDTGETLECGLTGLAADTVFFPFGSFDTVASGSFVLACWLGFAVG